MSNATPRGNGLPFCSEMLFTFNPVVKTAETLLLILYFNSESTYPDEEAFNFPVRSSLNL